MPATEIASAVEAGELSAAEIVEAHLTGMADAEKLNAIITPCADEALQQAKAGPTGPLAGVPLLVKDLFDTEGIRTTYGSTIHADHVPTETAASVAKLQDAGAILIAKTNLHEFAWGTTSQNPYYGYVESPVYPGRVAGGSSGGNAAALAVHVGTISVGTDTAGSVRIPAACCKTVGHKPSPGKVPMGGCLPLSTTFDVAGPMTRTVADCALVYSVLTGEPVPQPQLEGLTVGVLPRAPRMSPHELGADTGADSEDDSLAQVRGQLESLGARLVQVELPEPDTDLVPIFLAEAAESHRATFPSRRAEYGPDLQAKLDAAGEVPASDVAAAQRALPEWRERAASEPAVDLVVTPTLGGPVPELEVWEPDVRIPMITYTRAFSFLGWPAIAIGGLQFAGRDDQVVLGAAVAWEQAFGPP